MSILQRSHLQEALLLASPQRWVRGEARYDRRTGLVSLITEGETRPDVYRLDPIAAKELVYDLSEVADARSALRFVRTWGLLGQGPDEVLTALATEGATMSEPLDQMTEVGSLFARLLRIWTAIRTGGDLRPFEPYPWSTLAPNDEPGVRVRLYLATVVNDGMNVDSVDGRDRPAEILVWDRTSDRFWIGVHARSLLARAFRELARIIASNIELRTCDGCGRSFEAGDPRQRYHSPQCRQAHNMRRYRRPDQKGGRHG